MPRVEPIRAHFLGGHHRERELRLSIDATEVSQEALEALGSEVVIYAAGQDPVAEYEREVCEALDACRLLAGTSAGPALRCSANAWYAAWSGHSLPCQHGLTQLAAAQALLARLQAQQQKPVGEMTIDEKVQEILSAGEWPMIANARDGGVCLHLEHRDRHGEGASFDDALTAYIRNLREEGDGNAES